MNSRAMVLVEGGSFRMGSDEFYPDERPVHERDVDRFWVDRYEVTNEQYAEFVDATGYITVAERELDPSAFPGADPADLVPGAMVFTPTSGPVDLGNWRAWWRWQPGASWRHPFGPESSIDDRLPHPVVHVAFRGCRAPMPRGRDAAAHRSRARVRGPGRSAASGSPGATSHIQSGVPRRTRGWGDSPTTIGASEAQRRSARTQRTITVSST